MAKVLKAPNWVRVAYVLQCDFKRAQAISDNFDRLGIEGAKVEAVYNPFGPSGAGIEIEYATLADAVRLDPIVREALASPVYFDVRTNVRHTRYEYTESQHIDLKESGPVRRTRSNHGSTQ